MISRFFMRFPGFRAKAFTLSYDDGVEQDIKLIEILNRYGLKCTFNLNSGKMAPEGTVYEKGRIHRPLTASACKEVYNKDGHEVATHGYTHPWPTKLATSGVIFEIMKDRELLEDMYGRIVNGHAYPFGDYDDRVVECLRSCGITYARTTHSTERFDIPTDWLRLHPTCHHNHPRVFELIDNFNAARPASPKMFYLWGHSYEFEGDGNWERIEDIAKLVSGRDDVWYATNGEIYEYVEAYRSLVFSADMTKVYNPTALEVFFVINGEDRSIAPGESLSLA